MTILTTGIQSGIGRYIYENFGGIGITRKTSIAEFDEIKREGVDIIIHCAFNSKKDITSKTLYEYFKDNVLLTENLVSIPHKKFIFLSSVDIYPKTPEIHAEDEIINMEVPNRIYVTTKLISESIVKERSPNFLILRPTTMLGNYSRKNTLLKIIEEERCDVFLSDKSRFNYILYSDVLDFINLAIRNDIKGIFNVASSSNILLSEVVNFLNKKVHFGTYLYDVGNISNAKITSFFPAFGNRSEEVLMLFLEELRND